MSTLSLNRKLGGLINEKCIVTKDNSYKFLVARMIYESFKTCFLSMSQNTNGVSNRKHSFDSQ